VTANAIIIRRRAPAAALSLALVLGACSPDVHEEAQQKQGQPAAGGTPNRDNTQAGVNSTIAPPGQGSALSDTTAGRLAPAGVSGPTQALSAAAPTPQNSNAQTRAQTTDSTAAARPAQAPPRASAAPVAAPGAARPPQRR
jgi:hypothetical protein